MLNQQEEGCCLQVGKHNLKIEGIEINHYNRYPKYIKLIAQDIEKSSLPRKVHNLLKCFIRDGWETKRVVEIPSDKLPLRHIQCPDACSFSRGRISYQ